MPDPHPFAEADKVLLAHSRSTLLISYTNWERRSLVLALQDQNGVRTDVELPGFPGPLRTVCPTGEDLLAALRARVAEGQGPIVSADDASSRVVAFRDATGQEWGIHGTNLYEYRGPERKAWATLTTRADLAARISAGG